jgi:hypothetical protein
MMGCFLFEWDGSAARAKAAVPDCDGYGTPANASVEATSYDVSRLQATRLRILSLATTSWLSSSSIQRKQQRHCIWTHKCAGVHGRDVFASQPTNTSVVDGRPAVLMARAIADPDPTYQWFKDGARSTGRRTELTYCAAAFQSMQDILCSSQ